MPGVGGAGMPQGGPAAPVGAPMLTPENKQGDELRAVTRVHVAMNMLESALGMFGSEAKEGRMIIDILKKLGNAFGEQKGGADLQAAEIQQMQESFRGTPEQQLVAASQPRMAAS